MLSKFLRTTYKTTTCQLLLRRVPPRIMQVRYTDLIPPSQYDIPFPKKFQMSYALKVYWEIIPLLASTLFAVLVMFSAIIWTCRNKVDLVFSTHNRNNISRTMDLRNPSVHKVIIINQRYEPWPEMQDVLDKMKSAEKRALVRAQTCSLVS